MARLFRRSCAAALLFSVFSGCVDSAEIVSGDERRAIVNGTLEPDEPAVVLIAHMAGGACTGTVIAPRVVLTAKHCLFNPENRTQRLGAWGFAVLVGANERSFTDQYGVVEVRNAPPDSATDYAIMNSDIGLLILDRDFTQGTKQWEFEPWPGFGEGSTITAIGYGQTRFADPYSAGTKYRRDGRVAAVGPVPMYGVGEREFVSNGENTCQGDSGGPLFFQDVVVGVVSRGEEGCTGLGTQTRVSSFADLITQALRDTGACIPGDVEICNGRDDDCHGGVDNGIAGCGCTGGAPPSAEVCDGIDNDCNGEIDDVPNCGCTGGAPASDEACDGIDNDCNGMTDEVCTPIGEPCTSGAECAGGLCEDVGGAMVCTAICVAGMDPCPEGTHCSGATCGEGRCVPGQGGAGNGDSCSGHGDCASQLCVPASDGGSVCARPCVPDQLDCYATEVCAAFGDGCGACLKPHRWDPQRWFGEPCESDAECLSGSCLTDGETSRCGDGCLYRFCAGPCGDGQPCPPGGHCRDGTCVRGPSSEPGETCRADADCPGGRCIDRFGTPRCVHPCSPEGFCDGPFACWEGVCWPDLLWPGDPCNEGEEQYCSGGLCDYVGDERLCLESCTAARDCTSGLACVPYGDGAMGVCIPSRFAVGSGGGGGGDGCGCSSAGPRPSGLALALLLLGAALFRRSRF